MEEEVCPKCSELRIRINQLENDKKSLLVAQTVEDNPQFLDPPQIEVRISSSHLISQLNL